MIMQEGVPWIGVDLDGTLAHYEYEKPYVDPLSIGEPVPLMLEQVKAMLANGKVVKIMTARVDHTEKDKNQVIHAIQNWTLKHLGTRLQVTNCKDRFMVELWDDRAIAVQPNTGEIL